MVVDTLTYVVDMRCCFLPCMNTCAFLLTCLADPCSNLSQVYVRHALREALPILGLLLLGPEQLGYHVNDVFIEKLPHAGLQQD